MIILDYRCFDCSIEKGAAGVFPIRRLLFFNDAIAEIELVATRHTNILVCQSQEVTNHFSDQRFAFGSGDANEWNSEIDIGRE